MYKLFLCLVLFVVSSLVHCQVLSRVRIRGHREYMIDVISETVRDLERREWSSIRLPDFSQDVNEHIVYWSLNGTVHYTNGFIVSIQQIDILNDSFNQIWTESADRQTVIVEQKGQLRMSDVTLGFDVNVRLLGEDKEHHYTGDITLPLVTYSFSVFRDVHTHNTTISIVGAQSATTNLMRFLPEDRISDSLSVYFDPRSTAEGVAGLASEVFLPIATDVVANRVPFPELCYDCPVESYLNS